MDSRLDTDRSGVPGWLLVAGMLGSAIACFWSAGDHVTATLLGVMLLAGLSGYRVGALKLLGFFGGIAQRLRSLRSSEDSSNHGSPSGLAQVV